MIKWCSFRSEQRKAAKALRHKCRMAFANAAISDSEQHPFGTGFKGVAAALFIAARTSVRTGDKPPCCNPFKAPPFGHSSLKMVSLKSASIATVSLLLSTTKLAAQSGTTAPVSQDVTGNETTNQVIDWLLADGIEVGKRILLALLIFVIGRWITAILSKKIRSLMEKKEVDPALVSFGSSIIYYVLMIAVVLAAIQQLGFQTTSLVAILGAAGLAVGLALQGSLSNFAAGVLIIMFRPFRIGDFVQAGGESGVIQEIGVLMTIMKSGDNKKIIVPNSAIMSGSIINVTANETRRVDMRVAVGYNDDLNQVIDIINEVLDADDRVLAEPARQVVVAEMADSSVNLHVRPWSKTEDYWGIYFDFQKTIKERFDQAGITIPYPQRDVYMHQVQ